MKQIIFKRAAALSAFLGFAACLGANLPDPASVSGLKNTRQGDAVLLEGNSENNWGSMMFPQTATPDQEIKGTFTITAPGKKFSPPTPYWPLNYHVVENEPGYDFAILVRSENHGVFYRFQFSTAWNEVSLWKEGLPGANPETPSIPSGFFAAVRNNAGIKLNQPRSFTVKVIGNKLELSLDGTPVLRYEDKVLPLAKGGWGISAFNGAGVKVSGLETSKASGSIDIPARKRPDFKVVNWHRGGSSSAVIFDGDEPIAFQSHGTAAWLTDIKFMPGYRAQAAWSFVFDNVSRASMWKSLAAAGDKVEGVVVVAGKGAVAFKGEVKLTLSYDAKQDVYVYDADKWITFKRDNSETKILRRNSIYFLNLYPYNSMPTTDDSVNVNYFNWSTASSPYKMALVKLNDGKPYRWPVHHFYQSFQKSSYKPGGSVFWQSWNDRMILDKKLYFILYPESVVCPSFELLDAGEAGQDYEFVLDSCCQYWDMHFWYRPLRNGKPLAENDFKTGNTFREKFRIFGTPAAAADALMKQSQLLPNLDPAVERPFYVNGLNRFQQGGNVENTPGKLIWDGGAWDKTFGRDDKSSLRFDGNGSSSVFLGYNGASASARKVQISFWVKSEKPWTGNGVRLAIEGRGRFGGTDRQWSPYVVPSDSEWKQLVYDFPYPTYYEVSVLIQSQGSGKVWVDDFEYKILEK